MIFSRVQNSCNKNRAEELGPDVWDYFVIPHFFNEIQIRQATKPCLVQGGRGSGKTMLLRYFSYQSVFSLRREEIGPSDLEYIGLYWKADTQFARQMGGRGVDDADWVAGFQHYLALVISLEILRAVRAVAASRFAGFSQPDLEKLDFSSLSGYMPDLPRGFVPLEQRLVTCRRTFETWLNNPHTLVRPVFLPGRSFVLAIIEEIKAQAACFKSTIFSLYLDEYENLTSLQRRVVNTELKHSEIPLIVHLAMKRGSLTDRGTLGDEFIVEVADYRTHDLDDLLQKSKFDLFAAEVLFSRFALAGLPNTPVTLTILKSPAQLHQREDAEYMRSVMRAAERLLPEFSDRELAARIWEDKTLRPRIEDDIRNGLSGTSLKEDQFTRKTPPEAILVTASLLSRESAKPREILDELDKLRNEEDNRFTGSTNWIHNNLFGSILRIYSSSQKPCALYAGFRTFIHLAHGNLRHFLELCDRCLVSASDEHLMSGIPVEVQAEAARHASSVFLTQVRNFGPRGYALRNFVLSLGTLFALAQSRAAQSEPEITHFSLKGGAAPTKDDSDLLGEAVKWSVLFEERETKVKDQGGDVMDADWVLNPIYAPYFKISYRKKRKLPLTLEEFRIMVQGEFEQRSELIKRYRRNWNLEKKTQDLPQFAFLDEMQ